MNWKVLIDGEERSLSLERDGDNWQLEGEPASVIEVEPAVYSVIAGGRSYELRVERDLPEGAAVNVRGRRYVIELLDPRRLSRKGHAPGREGRQSMAAPMPGKVVRVLAAAGDQVEAGQGLIVIEAMKMQNEMRAPKAGRVVSLTAVEGATVAAGEVLAVVE